VSGYPRQVWWNDDGETVVESYSITDMAHGAPLGIAANDERYGATGAFMIEAGISSSYHIAQFFGLTARVHQPKATVSQSAASKPISAKPIVTEHPPETAAGIKVRASGDRRAEPRPAQPRRAIDVGAVITRALTAAGLIR